MNNSIIDEKLRELKNEYEAGTQQLKHLEQRNYELRNTLLRISGAIQVLEEIKIQTDEHISIAEKVEN